MAKHSADIEGCLICGDLDTVKSDIFSRALIHDQRGDDRSCRLAVLAERPMGRNSLREA